MLCLLIFLSSAQSAPAAEYILKLLPRTNLLSLENSQIQRLAYNQAANIYKVNIDSPAIVKSLQNNKSQVQYLVPNIKIQIPTSEMAPLAAQQKQWNLEKIRAESAWQLAGNHGSKKIVVAVIDTGVDANHPDLKGNVIEGYNFLDNTTNAQDENGHGTHCAGVIGATGASASGVLGISPEVTILPLRFLSARATGDLFTGITAIDYAIAKKVDIISASWGAQLSKPELIPPFQEAAERADKANVLLVTAAGNLNRDNDAIDYYPANAASPSIISVAATDEADRKIDISNFGAKNVQLAAPGIRIVSTYLKGGYATLLGTSMATPLVAGLAALIKAQHPQLRATELRSILMQNGAAAEVQDACKCRIDAESAMRYVLLH